MLSRLTSQPSTVSRCVKRSLAAHLTHYSPRASKPAVVVAQVIHLCFKVVLAGLNVLLGSASPNIKLYIGIIILLVYNGATTICQPFRKATDDHLWTVSLLTLTFMLFGPSHGPSGACVHACPDLRVRLLTPDSHTTRSLRALPRVLQPVSPPSAFKR